MKPLPFPEREEKKIPTLTLTFYKMTNFEFHNGIYQALLSWKRNKCKKKRKNWSIKYCQAPQFCPQSKLERVWFHHLLKTYNINLMKSAQGVYLKDYNTTKCTDQKWSCTEPVEHCGSSCSWWCRRPDLHHREIQPRVPASAPVTDSYYTGKIYRCSGWQNTLTDLSVHLIRVASSRLFSFHSFSLVDRINPAETYSRS